MRICSAIVILFALLSCEPSLCDCIHAEKKSNGEIKDEKLRIHCDEIMAARKKELEKSDVEGEKALLKQHQEEIEDCIAQ